MQDRNLYVLAPAQSAAGADRELELAALRDWLRAMSAGGLGVALPGFIVRLDRMSRLALSAEQRLGILRELKRPILTLVAGLPKPLPGADRPTRRGGISLEQRLYCLMIKNLKQALLDLDYSGQPLSAEVERRRRWTVRNLYRFMARQIETGISRQLAALPEGTWHELHDLNAYVTARAFARPRLGARRRGEAFDPESEYRRLLLLGLIGRAAAGSGIPPSILAALPHWAAETRLADPSPYVGELKQFVVDLTQDIAPCRIEGPITDVFHGFVLLPPVDCRASLTALQQGGSLRTADELHTGFRIS
jgi:hypothetical protein